MHFCMRYVLLLITGISTSYSPENQQVAQETMHSSYGISTHRHVGGTHQSSLPEYHHQHSSGSSQHVVHHPSLYSQTQYLPNEQYNPSMQVPNLYPPSPSYGLPQYHSNYTGSYTAQQHYNSPQKMYLPQQYAPQFSHNMHYSSNHVSPAPPDVNGMRNKVTVNLPKHRIPVDSPILWDLSQDIKEWRFLGRYLDLDENMLEEIDQYTRPNKMRDKALSVLKKWVDNVADPTWHALGEALIDSEMVLLHEKLCDLLKVNKI